MSGDYDDDTPSLHQEVPQDKEAPSGALPQAPGNTSADPMGEVMVAAGPEAPTIARIATRYGITEGDPSWILAIAVRDATAAGAVAAEAAERIEAATRGVGDLVFRQAVAAGADIAASAGQAIETKTVEAGSALVAVIQHSAQAGAAALKAAAMSIPSAAAAQRDAILSDWKAALTTTAAEEAAGRARRGERWLMAAIAATMAAMAGLGGWVGRATAPQAWPAGAPPSAVWRYPQQNMDEYAWPATTARVAQRCVAGDVCLELRRR